MNYIKVKQAAEKWGVSTRRVQDLCKRGQLGYLLDDRLALADTEALKEVKALHKQLNAGWTKLHNAVLEKSVSISLSQREREVARLAASGSPLVSPAGFRFGLYEGQRLVAVSELSGGVGEARFILNYELKDEGTYTYTLKEIIPETPIITMTVLNKKKTEDEA